MTPADIERLSRRERRRQLAELLALGYARLRVAREKLGIPLDSLAHVEASCEPDA